MAANNETGVLHPLEAIAALCHDHGALLLVDAAQMPASPAPERTVSTRPPTRCPCSR